MYQLFFPNKISNEKAWNSSYTGVDLNRDRSIVLDGVIRQVCPEVVAAFHHCLELRKPDHGAAAGVPAPRDRHQVQIRRHFIGDRHDARWFIAAVQPILLGWHKHVVVPVCVQARQQLDTVLARKFQVLFDWTISLHYGGLDTLLDPLGVIGDLIPNRVPV